MTVGVALRTDTGILLATDCRIVSNCRHVDVPGVKSFKGGGLRVVAAGDVGEMQRAWRVLWGINSISGVGAALDEVNVDNIELLFVERDSIYHWGGYGFVKMPSDIVTIGSGGDFLHGYLRGADRSEDNLKWLVERGIGLTSVYCDDVSPTVEWVEA